MNKVYNSYQNGECPDCGEKISKKVKEGDSCKNCDHVFTAEQKIIQLIRDGSKETLRLTVRDAIQEYFEGGLRCFGDPVEVTCDIADIVFEALGISPQQQDIEGAIIRVVKPKRKSPPKIHVSKTYIILNWWYDETIAKAMPVMKDDGSGETMVFESRKAANDYAKKELNGYWKVMEE